MKLKKLVMSIAINSAIGSMIKTIDLEIKESVHVFFLMNLGQFLSKLNLYLTDLYRKPENVSPLCCVLSFVPM